MRRCQLVLLLLASLVAPHHLVAQDEAASTPTPPVIRNLLVTSCPLADKLVGRGWGRYDYYLNGAFFPDNQ